MCQYTSARFLPIPTAIWLVTFLASGAPAEPMPVPALKAPAEEMAGSLVLSGHGGIPEAASKRFLELAGGGKAKLVIIADPDAGSDARAKLLASWQKRGAASVVLLHASKQADAAKPDFAKPLTQASGVWLEGSAERLLAVYQGTPVEKELHKLLQRGGTIGGDAAATAVFGPKVARLGNPSIRIEPGFNLMPGFLVESNLKANQLSQLSAKVARCPGYVGMGIEPKTAVIVKGRLITVVGDARAELFLPASKQKPASVKLLSQGDRVDLIALSRAAIARTQEPFPPAKPRPPNVEKGTLIIGGGGPTPTEVWRRFIQIAGGPNAAIVVIPTALEDPVPREPGEVKFLKRMGVKNVKVLHTRSRAEADKPEFWAPLKKANGVWLSGGRQWRFVDAYLDTATEKALHEVLGRGGVIAGSSAGASIQSEYMPRGDPLGNRQMMAEGYERGFGFLRGTAVDQHFFVRKRQRDMTELVTAYPQLLGIGIDEGTAIIVQGPIMEVVGKSKVAVFDTLKRHVKGAKDYEELPAGSIYNLETRRRGDQKAKPGPKEGDK